ncbi:hypothetical protein ACTXI9_17005 [Brachybacterium alimentarium]|uniref:hypothetical protein n=1 Tax=Brachybacterium alimentarium TaxID=47845 RepID=UPI003FD0C7B7
MSSPDFDPTKQCSKCRTIKPKREFARNRSAFDGHQNQCKQCRAATYRAQKARGGAVKRVADDTITPGNPLSDLDTTIGRAVAEDIAWAVAGRVIKQQGGVRFLDGDWSDEDIQRLAMGWILTHKGEASRIEQPGTAVKKITERITRTNRGVFRNPNGIRAEHRRVSLDAMADAGIDPTQPPPQKRNMGHGPDA